VTPSTCVYIDIYQHFLRTCCPHLQENVDSRFLWHLGTSTYVQKLYTVTSQKTIIFMLIAIRASNFIFLVPLSISYCCKSYQKFWHLLADIISRPQIKCYYCVPATLQACLSCSYYSLQEIKMVQLASNDIIFRSNFVKISHLVKNWHNRPHSNVSKQASYWFPLRKEIKLVNKCGTTLFWNN
jgi:hypothetical protein